jgi:steroid delta-isomerase-like uncharacterized protein
MQRGFRSTLSLLLLSASAASALDLPATNEAIARRVFRDILSQGHFDLAATLYAPDFVNHGQTRDADLATDQAAARGWREAAPDIELAPELTVAEGDLIAVLWRARGTNTGAGNGLPATGRHVDARGVTLWRIDGGRIREEWSEFGMLDLLQQAGLVPFGPGEAPPSDARSHAYPAARSAVSDAEREANRRIARQVFGEIVGEGRLDLFDRLYAPGYVNHGAHRDSTVAEEIEATRSLRTLAPDLAVSVISTVAQGDLVCVVWSARGTHTGPALGWSATGKPFRLRGMSILRLAAGRITDEWSVLDRYSALVQLGLLPAP